MFTVAVDKGRAIDVINLDLRKAFANVQKTSLSLSWKDMDLTDRLMSKELQMVTLKEFQSTAQHPGGYQ